MEKRVLVTGGAGFIGCNFVHFCREHRKNWQLTVVDKLTYAGNLENIRDYIERGEVAFVRADIADPEAMRGVFAEGFDYVFHFAAESHVDRSIEAASEFVITNVVGTEVLLSAARHSEVKRFIHVSTDEVYGSLGAEGVFYENTPLDPTSPYAASKASSDLIALAFAKTYGMDIVVTRCTNNYGPFQFPEKFIPLFVTNALEDKSLPLYGDGFNVRSWLHVLDHCEALALAAERGGAGEIYNIGSGADGELPNREVAAQILNIVGKPSSLLTPVRDRLAHDRRYAVSTEKIEKELGWKARKPFAQGLRETVDWYVQHRPWWQRVKSGEYKDFYERNYGDIASPVLAGNGK